MFRRGAAKALLNSFVNKPVVRYATGFVVNGVHLS